MQNEADLRALDLSEVDIEKMNKYGITRVSVDQFHVGEFRYTSLPDAIAEGKRRQTKT